jgi:hypothetical protein
MIDKVIDVQELLGRTFKFYGATEGCFKIDEEIYEVREDENDGYRSAMEGVFPVVGKGLIFFSKPLDKVVFKEAPSKPDPDSYHYGVFDGWEMVSVKDGHRWLLFGTDNSDDWYPSYTFSYTPRDEDK